MFLFSDWQKKVKKNVFGDVLWEGHLLLPDLTLPRYDANDLLITCWAFEPFAEDPIPFKINNNVKIIV